MVDGVTDRARGALLGLACGDAVGTTLEFQSPGTFDPIDDMVGGGPFRLRAGQWTDDTSMALCLAESIVDSGGMDLDDQMRRYVLWREDGYLSSTGRCFDIGNTTSKALHRFATTGVAEDATPNEEAAANGSLMRLAPVPIAWHRDLDAAVEMSGRSSTTTHGAARPVDACRVMGAIVAALVAGADLEDVLQPSYWTWGPLHPAVEEVVRGSFRAKEPPAIRGTGYCVDALEAALWAVAGADSFEHAVLRAANLGDDADTTAAIAGQVAGARWGASGIPTRWLATLTDASRITSLADALVAVESPTPPGRWPFDDDVHAWWAEPGRVLAGEYPTSAGGAGTKLDVLIDAGIRTFVDLTTPADGLTPYASLVAHKAPLRGLDLRHLSWPIPDLGVVDHDGYRSIVDDIRAHADHGRPVYVHCWGGVGRTGTVIGCLLADETSDVDSLVARLAALRAGTSKAGRPCPETAGQRDALARWCRAT